jgi:2''-aminoglycoside nucleotidyltransferase
MDPISQHLAAIRALFDAAEQRALPLWLENGWAIDARLGRVTREHGDIDVAYPQDRGADYLDLLQSLGYSPPEPTDYGFLCWRDGTLLDSEPCHASGDEYGFAGFPAGACPPAKEGALRGYPVRCVSWEAMYFEFLGSLRDIPLQAWRQKDHESLRVVEAHLGEPSKRRLRELLGREA